METETKPAPKLAAIRTYAKDLDAERNNKTIAPNTKGAAVVDEQTKKEEPVRATDTLTAEVTKISVPTPTPIAKPEVKKPMAVPTLKPIAPTKKDPTIIVDNEDAAAATIITDTKRGEFKLIPAIIDSIRGWFKTKQQSYQAKKIPKYTVPDTTRRKGIIQKATSKSGKFAAADFSSIQERILERKAAAAKVKEDIDEPETIWTANTEPGFPLLTEATVPQEISNVQLVARKSFRAVPEEIVITAPTPVISPELEIETESEPDDGRWSAPVQETKPTPTLPAVAVVDEPAPIPVEVTEEVAIEPVTESEPETAPPSPQAEIKRGKFSLLKVNTNTLTVFVSGVVVLFALLSATVYFAFYKDSTLDSSESLPETLLVDTEVNPLLLYTISADTLIEAFNSMRNERGTTQGVYMYTSTIGSTETVDPSQILSALELTLAADFAQTVSAVRVGYINQAPYLVLQIKNETAAQGGLLMWEDTMYSELTPLLSLAPEATDTFLDATISGTDVRVLKNINGAERLLYGMVSDTIVITTNSASYAQLTTLLK